MVRKMTKGDLIYVLGGKQVAAQVAFKMESVGIKVKVEKDPETKAWCIILLEDLIEEQMKIASDLLR